MNISEREAERFWAKVQVGPGCWPWTASLHTAGYGQFTVGRKPRRAHRVSYELHNGPIPPGVLVLHSCDNRLCVNPTHLHLGNQALNAQECWGRGRGVNQYVGPGKSPSDTCPNGHRYDEKNTAKALGTNGHVHRRCRSCAAAKSRAYRLRRST